MASTLRQICFFLPNKGHKCASSTTCGERRSCGLAFLRRCPGEEFTRCDPGSFFLFFLEHPVLIFTVTLTSPSQNVDSGHEVRRLACASRWLALRQKTSWSNKRVTALGRCELFFTRVLADHGGGKIKPDGAPRLKVALMHIDNWLQLVIIALLCWMSRRCAQFAPRRDGAQQFRVCVMFEPARHGERKWRGTVGGGRWRMCGGGSERNCTAWSFWTVSWEI